MLVGHSRFSPSRTRHGKILVLFALLLPALLGMVGLVVDGGLLMGGHRQVQNAADSAALAAALELYRGQSPATASATATTMVQTYNGLAGATVDTRIPPTTGPHAGDAQYVEVVVTLSINTLFMQAVGASPTSTVQARACAGFEAIAEGEGAIVLDPLATPGLDITGGATLRVNGAVLVNSRSAGLDQYSQWVDWGYQQYALTCSNNSTVEANLIQVRGGVDVVANYHNIDPLGPNPLYCRAPISPDPLRNLPVPTQANVSSISNWNRIPAITINSGQNRTLNPGVYEDIVVLQNTTVNFTPGVYILSPTKPNQGFRTNGSTTITGNGVMFYATGSNYLAVSPGYWDSVDGILDGPLPPNNGPDQLPPPPDPNFNQVYFATVDINATNSTVTFTGLQDPNDPFHDILFFQRRRNRNQVQIQGRAGENVFLGGTIYSKWARFKLAGDGRFDAQFVVGSMQVAGQASVTINSTGKGFGRANQVFLVE